MTSPEVLVVDDDADIREVIGLLLEAYGYRARVASDGYQALEQLRLRRDVALILLDLMMPGLDGIEMMKALKADTRLAQIPVIVMSGDSAASATTVSIGANGCLPKPVDLDGLLSTVRHYVRDGADATAH
jgi:CheY-like chemotaxis protein